MAPPCFQFERMMIGQLLCVEEGFSEEVLE